MYTQRLGINSEVFDDLRGQFDVLLAALLQEANVTGKEGELSVKLKVKTAIERNMSQGTFVEEWTEPRLEWTIARKVKESKYDVKSSSGRGFRLEFDSDGRPTIKESPNKQVSMFDTPFSRAIDEMESEDESEDMDELDADEIGEAMDNLTEDFSHENLDSLDRITEEVDDAASFEDEMNCAAGEENA